MNATEQGASVTCIFHQKVQITEAPCLVFPAIAIAIRENSSTESGSRWRQYECERALPFGSQVVTQACGLRQNVRRGKFN
jgi:hypothetical protein